MTSADTQCEIGYYARGGESPAGLGQCERGASGYLFFEQSVQKTDNFRTQNFSAKAAIIS